MHSYAGRITETAPEKPENIAPEPLWQAGLPALGALAAYLLTSFIHPQSNAVWYLLNIVVWGAAGAFAFWTLWRRGVSISSRRSMILVAALAGAFQVAVLMLAAGFTGGFGGSPFRRDAPGLLFNLLYIAATLGGLEFSRAALVDGLKDRNPSWALAAATLLFAVLATPLGRFSGLTDARTIIQHSGEIFLPTLVESLLASYLVLTAGPLPAIAYHGVLLLFEFYSPILPDLEWIMTAFIGTLAPAFNLWIIQAWLTEEEETADDPDAPARGSNALWIIVAVLALGLLWFNSGALGVQPTMITGPSMEPELALGDIVIVKPIDAAEVEVGDVIRFQYENIHILHRVIAINETDGQITFTTKGDNNDDPDHDPVTPEQLEGKAVMTIPKVGLLSIGVRRVLAWHS